MNSLEESQRLRRIYEAIPPLPDPDTLYNKILHGSVQLRIITRSISDLFNRIISLRKSEESPKERLLQLQILETMWDKTHMALSLLRSEMRMLFAVVPLLIACEIVSERKWESMLRRPQWDDQGKSLLLDHNLIEKIITDQFDLMEEHRLMLNEENHETKSLHEMLNSSLSHIQTVIKEQLDKIALSSHSQAREIDELKTLLQAEAFERNNADGALTEVIQKAIADAISKITRLPHAACDSSFNVNGEGEGIEMLDQAPSHSSDEAMIQEANIIEQNAEFMEKIEFADDVESVHRAQRQQRYAVEKEIGEKYAKVDDLEALIADLSSEPKCEPRNFDKGIIRRKDEKGICCVFCGKTGIHYSDSCTEFQKVEERKRLLQLHSRCECCLEIIFDFHRCRKAMLPCFHCKERGHHSAICAFPEISEGIQLRINEALEERRNTLRRIAELDEQLQQLM